jgi:hypothetical protein
MSPLKPGRNNPYSKNKTISGMHLKPFMRISMPRISAFVVLLFLLQSCGTGDRKVKVDDRVSIYVDASQPVLPADSLAAVYNRDKAAYNRTFKDSTIFVTGNIESMDQEHGEVLLKHSYPGIDVVCVVKDTLVLPALKVSDKVLFKGVCHVVGGHGVILIGQCALAQIKSSAASPGEK